MKPITENLAINLRKIRNGMGLTLEQLSAMSGVVPVYINRIEMNNAKRVSLLYVAKLAQALNVSICELIGGELNHLSDLDKEILIFKNEVIKYGGAPTVEAVRKSIPSLYAGRVPAYAERQEQPSNVPPEKEEKEEKSA